MPKISRENDNVINPTMFITARESRGLTQKELSGLLGVTQGWLSKVESGFCNNVPDDILHEISKILNYPCGFFFQQDRIYGFGPSELFNRRRQRVPAKTLQKIYAQINIRRIQLAKILQHVEIGELNIPRMDINDFRGSVDDIASAVRAYWHIPAGPIKNLVEIIEERGGIILPFDFHSNDIDAISIVVPGTPPLFFINPTIPGDRLRFTLCHELAHVIMHQCEPNPDIELQADRFASQFLMPDNEIRPYLQDLSIAKLMDLKTYWRVSMQSILMKATKLAAITDARSKALWMKIGTSGYRSHEPIEIQPEVPTLYDEILEVFKNDLGYSLNDFSQFVCMSTKETAEAYFATGSKLKLVKN